MNLDFELQRRQTHPGKTELRRIDPLMATTPAFRCRGSCLPADWISQGRPRICSLDMRCRFSTALYVGFDSNRLYFHTFIVDSLLDGCVICINMDLDNEWLVLKDGGSKWCSPLVIIDTTLAIPTISWPWHFYRFMFVHVGEERMRFGHWDVIRELWGWLSIAIHSRAVDIP